MIQLVSQGVYIKDGMSIVVEDELFNKHEAEKKTLAHSILSRHNRSGRDNHFEIQFDTLASHDITYVGIIQTARASGLKAFPIPYVLTNCHNSLCAVGGTINEDDHMYGLSAAKKYGGIYVPPHLAVIHQYMREAMTGCGKMILGSDSHTRYGALGTMGFGEGGPELVKQLMGQTYDISRPQVVAVYLEGTPSWGVGPQDVALAIIGAVFEKGFAKNKILEFVGPGIGGLSVDYRNGIDVMTTETTCLSSIWCTDKVVEDFYKNLGRPEEYRALRPDGIAYYDGMIRVNLSKIEPMIALPFHPSNVYTIETVKKHGKEIFEDIESDFQKRNPHLNMSLGLVKKATSRGIQVDQGIIAGCAGGLYENIAGATSILSRPDSQKQFFNMSVYPASESIHLALIENGFASDLIQAGIAMKTAFCGPCFGAGDVPAHQSFSIRHTTRNFPSREGSKPSDGQVSSVALMDALSIAATASCGGFLTGANEVAPVSVNRGYAHNQKINEKRVYNGYKKADDKIDLIFGPNITDWPVMIPLPENLLLTMAAVIHDDVTTTDELIPSGDTSSYRSNPLKLATFTLSRKDPKYVPRAKDIQEMEFQRRQSVLQGDSSPTAVQNFFEERLDDWEKAIYLPQNTGLGSLIFARKPGDGSAREQAASCQRVLGGVGNIAWEYATKRYRSNLINWGMLPFVVDKSVDFQVGDNVLVPNIRQAIEQGKFTIDAYLIRKGHKKKINLSLEGMTKKESQLILDGCLMNYYEKNNQTAG